MARKKHNRTCAVIPPEHRRAMVELYLSGLTQRQAAAKFGYNESSASDALQRAGITSRRKFLTDEQRRGRRRLAALLQRRGRSRPVVRCPHRGLWVEPELVCEVNYLEWTRSGRLRGASFQRLLAEP